MDGSVTSGASAQDPGVPVTPSQGDPPTGATASTDSSAVATDATAASAVASDPAVPASVARPLPRRMTLLANRDLKWGDQVIPEGTELARLTLRPGAPYGLRYLTRCIEDGLVIEGPPPTS